MAETGVQLDREMFSCSVCLNLLRDPVSTPCGHSYCMDCVQGFWDQEEAKGKIPSCPQCRQTYSPRPILLKNTMLAVLVEEIKKSEPPADDGCYAGPEDVACDFCTGRKRKACKSCLVCLVSYCKSHLQPHYESPRFDKHKLVEPTKMLQENICPHHHEVMKMFCRTDHQCICYLCPVHEHKGHVTVSAAAERADRQKEIEASRQNIQVSIQAGESDVSDLGEKLVAAAHSADAAAGNSERIFGALVRLLEKKSLAVKQGVRSQQEAEAARLEAIREKLQERVAELRARDAELLAISESEDDGHFLRSYTALSPVSESWEQADVDVHPVRYSEELLAAISEVREKLQEFLQEEQASVPAKVADLEPSSREDFLKYSCNITIDKNTAHVKLLLSDGDTRATLMPEDQYHLNHHCRFLLHYQALSKQSLKGRCYWEVSRKGRVYIGVAYKSITRAVQCTRSAIGFNDKSWALLCERGEYSFLHNGVTTPVTGSGAAMIGMYLDYSAGTLSFYSVTQGMTLMHRVQATFTEPLHAAVRFYHNWGDVVDFC
ncbi:tripartite motif-containing protein 16-like [Nelusetta ayraudi]|uniref:tripartite motif-containing protein 16-like n=1 Tax=Nelusetta ayraudi TaxID=303726 RepID=UPI003F7045BB